MAAVALCALVYLGGHPRARLTPLAVSHAQPRAHLSLTAVGDPVRAGRRPPIEPLAINALASALKLASGADATAVADELVAKRAHDPDVALLPEEERLLRAWIKGALDGRDVYMAMLADLAKSEPWFEGELGMGAESNPYVMLCRAECILALFLLRDASADVRRDIAFIDADRLDVLRRAC